MNVQQTNKLIVGSFVLLLLTVFGGSVGCNNDDNAPKHRTISGKVSSIDLATNEVGMIWYNPKKKVEQETPGTLAPDSEILINGRTARLDEVMVDDNVEVTGRVEKHGGETKFVALKVYITRPESAPASATAPVK